MDIGLLSPGQMGSAVARRLQENGARVHTCLAGRSERTRALARSASLTEVGDVDTLVRRVDIVLSVVVPANAEATAASVAESVARTGTTIDYLDCNAVSPTTARRIAAGFSETPATFIDASIAGPPPERPGLTRLYVSGPDISGALALRDFGLDVRPAGTRIGQASALKMSISGVTKGIVALATQALLAARANGVDEVLLDEFDVGERALLEVVARRLPLMPMKSRRWVREMEEVAATYADAGISPAIFEGVAELCRWVGQSSLADETPEERDPDRGVDGVIDVLAAGPLQFDPNRTS